MSWGEIKKAVNSQLEIPLDDRMRYYYGFYPRGIQFKHVGHINSNIVYTWDNSHMLLVKGSGLIAELEALAISGAPYSNCRSSLRVILDAGTDTERTFTLSTNTNSTLNGNSKISVNINSPESSFNTWNNFNGAANTSYTVNGPIIFKKSLDVYDSGAITLWNSNYNMQAGGRVTYLLDDAGGGLVPKNQFQKIPGGKFRENVSDISERGCAA